MRIHTATKKNIDIHILITQSSLMTNLYHTDFSDHTDAGNIIQAKECT